MAGISPIGAGGYNNYDDYFKKKLEMQASFNAQPGGQSYGINGPQDIQGKNTEGLQTAGASAIGKEDPLAGLSTEAAGALIKEQQKEQAAAANVPDPTAGLNQLGINNMMLVKKRPEEEMPII